MATATGRYQGRIKPMELLSLYLREFNREILQDPRDRRELTRTVVQAVLSGACILAVGLVLLLL